MYVTRYDGGTRNYIFVQYLQSQFPMFTWMQLEVLREGDNFGDLILTGRIILKPTV
jgi:hypothetical protein